MTTRARATIEDLYSLPDHRKAEIVDGEIVLLSPTGDMPNRAGGSIYISLRQHEGKTKLNARWLISALTISQRDIGCLGC